MTEGSVIISTGFTAFSGIGRRKTWNEWMNYLLILIDVFTFDKLSPSSINPRIDLITSVQETLFCSVLN